MDDALLNARSKGQPRPLPSILGKGIEEEKGLTIPCARATRGRGLPSLDARTMGKRQAAHHDWAQGGKVVDMHNRHRPVMLKKWKCSLKLPSMKRSFSFYGIWSVKLRVTDNIDMPSTRDSLPGIITPINLRAEERNARYSSDTC